MQCGAKVFGSVMNFNFTLLIGHRLFFFRCEDLDVLLFFKPFLHVFNLSFLLLQLKPSICISLIRGVKDETDNLLYLFYLI